MSANRSSPDPARSMAAYNQLQHTIVDAWASVRSTAIRRIPNNLNAADAYRGDTYAFADISLSDPTASAPSKSSSGLSTVGHHSTGGVRQYLPAAVVSERVFSVGIWQQR